MAVQASQHDLSKGPKRPELSDEISIDASAIDASAIQDPATPQPSTYLGAESLSVGSSVNAIAKRGGDFAKNVSLMVLLFTAYSMVRSVTANEFGTAMANAADILRIQESVGLPSELSFQQAIIDRTGIVKAANYHYIGVHFPLTVAFLVWVWASHRQSFNRVRNTLIAVTAAGLVLHLTYPLAPPRMIEGFVDTGDWLGPDPYDTAVAAAANQIAAMPSLHVGWAFLVALSVIWIHKTRWRWLALAHPALTSAVVVITANHYWSDAIVAIALVALGWLLFSPRASEQLSPA